MQQTRLQQLDYDGHRPDKPVLLVLGHPDDVVYYGRPGKTCELLGIVRVRALEGALWKQLTTCKDCTASELS